MLLSTIYLFNFSDGLKPPTFNKILPLPFLGLINPTGFTNPMLVSKPKVFSTLSITSFLKYNTPSVAVSASNFGNLFNISFDIGPSFAVIILKKPSTCPSTPFCILETTLSIAAFPCLVRFLVPIPV